MAAHLDVLVHQFLSDLPAHQIPFGGLNKGVNDKVGSTFGHKRIQFLRGLSRRVNGGPRESPEGVDGLEILPPGGGPRGNLGEEAGRCLRIIHLNGTPDHQVALRSSGEDVIEVNLISELGDLFAELFEKVLPLFGRLLPKEIREAEHGVVVQLPARCCFAHDSSLPPVGGGTIS